MKMSVLKVLGDESGATAIEYGSIGAPTSVIIVAAERRSVLDLRQDRPESEPSDRESRVRAGSSPRGARMRSFERMMRVSGGAFVRRAPTGITGS